MVTPVRPALGEAPIFHFRGLLRLDAVAVSLPEEPGIHAPAWIPFALQTDREGTEIRSPKGQGSVRVELDQVPSTISNLAEAAGWETVVYTDNTETMPPDGDRLLVTVAYPAGSRDFNLDSFGDLDLEKRLLVEGFVPPREVDGDDRRSVAVPCTVTGVPVDRIDVTLTEGVVSFHTRPALWGSFYGFTVLAEGEVDGISFEIDSYWDLDYATEDMGTGGYGLLPMLAVRFPEQPDGACILVVQWDAKTFTDAYLGKILDCSQNTLRTVTVESVDVIPGGGENRW